MDLIARAAELYPGSPQNQAKWLAAVKWLRECSKVGYAIDGRAEKKSSPPLLHGYMAPLPPMRTVVSLPDEIVIPGEHVTLFKRKTK